MKNMKLVRKIIVGSLAMVAGAWSALAATPVMYLDPVFGSDGAVTGYAEKTVSEYTLYDSTTYSSLHLGSGWYVIRGNVTVSDTITIAGDVKFVLLDGAFLEKTKIEITLFSADAHTGTQVGPDSSLTIYAQSTSVSTMGSFRSYGGRKAAGIGGGSTTEESAGRITINGGHVVGEGGPGGAGIGGGNGGNGRYITINGGVVSGFGGDDGAGIGGGDGGEGSYIAINGGTVYGNAGKNGAGIGGGEGGDGKYITINHAEVKATAETFGGGEGAGIGGGDGGDGMYITINNSTVTGEGCGDGAGIGGGRKGSAAHIAINGGVVKGYAGGSAAIDCGAGIGGGGDTSAISALSGGDATDIVISGGDVTAHSQLGAAIGGGYYRGSGKGGYLKNLKISGGRVSATCSGRGEIKLSAAIGGYVCDNIEIAGGTVYAYGYRAIGSGKYGDTNNVTNVKFTGGSLDLSGEDDNLTSIRPVNSHGTVVVKTVVTGVKDSPATFEGLDGYGTKDIYPSNGEVYLWLAAKNYDFHTQSQCFRGNAGDTISSYDGYYAIYVNGKNIRQYSSAVDKGWEYVNHVLSFLDGDWTVTGSDLSKSVSIVMSDNVHVTFDGFKLINKDANDDLIYVGSWRGGNYDATRITFKGKNEIYAGNSHAAIYVSGKGLLFLNGDGELVGGRESGVNGRGLNVEGQLNFEGVTVRDYKMSGDYCGAGIALSSSGKLNMTSGKIEGCEAAGGKGGAVGIAGEAKAVFNGGTIGSSAASNGGAIAMTGSGTVDIYPNMNFTDFTSVGNGICYANAGTMNVWGGEFSGNQSKGAAIASDGTATVNVYGAATVNSKGDSFKRIGNSSSLNVYGGEYHKKPDANLLADGNGAYSVDNAWVVGKNVATNEESRIIGGTYTFDPSLSTLWSKTGLRLGTYYDAYAQGTKPVETYLVKKSTELKINGELIADAAATYSGEGWNYQGGVLTLDAAMDYELSGVWKMAMRIDVTANATVKLNGLHLEVNNPNGELFRITGKDVKMELNDHNNIFAKDGSAAFAVKSGAQLTVSGRYGGLYGSGNLQASGRCFLVEGKLVFNSGSIVDYCLAGNNSGAGIYVHGGSLEMNYGAILDCQCEGNGGAVAVAPDGSKEGSADLRDVMISRCKALNGDAVAILSGGGKVNIYDGMYIVECNTSGSIMYTQAEGANLNIWGGQFLRNTGTGSIFGAANGNCRITFYGGLMSENYCNDFSNNIGVKVWGGVFRNRPQASWIAANHAATQVGSYWVVGQNVAAEGMAITDGIYTFDPRGGDCEYVGLELAKYRTVRIDGTMYKSYHVELADFGLKVNGVDVCKRTGTGWNYDLDSGTLTFNSAMGYVLTGRCDDPQIGIKIDAGATVTLSNAMIATTSVAPISTELPGVTILLAGENELVAPDNKAGLECLEGSSVTIGLADGATDDTATLSVTGGKSSAGIGGNYQSACGTITITGGTIVANGGNSGAGIGGSYRKNVGDITISGGKVAAVGGDNAAGIGSGSGLPAAKITITGGEIVALGGAGGAGIGDGGNAVWATAHDIAISGGIIVAIGGKDASGIGCGYHGRIANVAISGGTITAQGTGSLSDDIGAVFTSGSVKMKDINVTIDGGSVLASNIQNPKNSNGDTVHRMTVVKAGEPGPEGFVLGGDLADYGQNDLFPIEETLYLWVKDGNYENIFVDEKGYSAKISGKNVLAMHEYAELYVNGVQVDEEEHDDWEYDGKVLTLTSTTNYVITGGATDGSVRIVVDADCNVTLDGVALSKANMKAGENLLVVNENKVVNLTIENSTGFKTSNGVAPIGVENGGVFDLVGEGTVLAWNIDLRGNGRILMEEPTTLLFTSYEDAQAAATTIKPKANMEDFPDIDQEAYANRFDVSVIAGTAPGTWNLDYQINAATSNEVAQLFGAATADLSANLAVGEPSAEVETIPGLYYGIAGATEASEVSKSSPPIWKSGQGGTLKVDGAVFAPTEKAFYQLRVRR